jgi:CheY-like chemotaxis protein
MTMNMIAPFAWPPGTDLPDSMTHVSQGVVAVVSDDPAVVDSLTSVCDFLDLRTEVVPAGQDLSCVLRESRPIAVIGDIEGTEQDGFHTMKQVARHDRDLPVMLLTGGDPVMMGAADAVQDAWRLSNVTRTGNAPLAGQLVTFLFAAGRRAGCLRLVPV